MSPQSSPSHRRILCAVASTLETGASGLAIATADRHAAKHALEFAAKCGAALRFVHVVDFLDARGHKSEAQVKQIVTDELTPELERLEAAARRLGISASHCFRRGKAWYQLLEEAHRWSADLLVISPRRDELSFGDRVVHGSTANRILRKSACPVWIVDPRSRVGVSRLLALVDRTSMSDLIIRTTEALAEAFGAERYALHCFDYPNDIALARMANAREAIAEYHALLLDQARGFLSSLTGGDDGGWTLLFEDDWVVRRAPKVVDEHEIDMVVLGGVSGRTLAGVLLGTTAEKLLERCQVSAYVIRPDDWVSPVQFDD